MTATNCRGDQVGPDGNYRALPDAISDELFRVVLALAAELWTVRDRTRLLEGALSDLGLEVRGMIDARSSEPAALNEMREDLDGFVQRLFSSLAPGEQGQTGS